MSVDPYKDGVLVKEHHERLVADLETYAKDAGIQPYWIYQALPDHFTKREIDYIRGFRKHANTPGAVCGLVYTGKNGVGSIEARMSAIAGCLVRNFVRARVMTLGSVLDHLAAKTMPAISCLLIPNFFYSAAEGGTIAPWQIAALLDFMSARQLQGQQTVIYATDRMVLKKEYGLGFGQMIDTHFLEVQV